MLTCTYEMDPPV